MTADTGGVFLSTEELDKLPAETKRHIENLLKSRRQPTTLPVPGRATTLTSTTFTPVNFRPPASSSVDQTQEHTQLGAQPADDDQARIEAQLRAEIEQLRAEIEAQRAKIEAQTETHSPVSPPESTQHAEIAALRAAKEAAETRAKAAEVEKRAAEERAAQAEKRAAQAEAAKDAERQAAQAALPDPSSDVDMVDDDSTGPSRIDRSQDGAKTLEQVETLTNAPAPSVVAELMEQLDNLSGPNSPAGTQHRDPPPFVQQDYGSDSSHSDSASQSAASLTSPCTSEEDPVDIVSGQPPVKAAAPESIDGPVTHTSKQRRPLPNGPTSSLPRRQSGRLRPAAFRPGPDGSKLEGSPSTDEAASPKTSLHVNDMGKLDEFLLKLDPDCSLVKIEGLEPPNVENTQIRKWLGPRKDAAVLAVRYTNNENVVYLEAQGPKQFKEPLNIPEFDAAKPQCQTMEQAEEFLKDLQRRSSTDADGDLKPYFVGPLSNGAPRKLLNPGSVLEEWRQANRTKPRQHISGVTTQWVHWGGPETGTAWHREDADLWSVNLNLGGWKLWILITDDGTVFEKQVRDLLDIAQDRRLCDQWLRHRALFISPAQLDDWKIEYKIIVQGPGEMVVTRSGQYHCVVNPTTSLAVAINIVPQGKPAFPKEEVFVCSECGLAALVGEEGCNFRLVDEDVGEAEDGEDDDGGQHPSRRNLPRKRAPEQQTPTSRIPSGPITPSKRRATQPSAERSSKLQKAGPTPEQLAASLVGKDAILRFMDQVSAWRRKDGRPDFKIDGTLREQATKYYRLGISCDGSSQLYALLSLILKTEAVAKLDAEAHNEGRLNLRPQVITDQALSWGKTNGSMCVWLSNHRKWGKVFRNFQAFLPFHTDDMKCYQGMSVKECEKFRSFLDEQPEAEILNGVGEGFVKSILECAEYRTGWENKTEEELRSMSFEQLMALLRANRGGE